MVPLLTHTYESIQARLLAPANSHLDAIDFSSLTGLTVTVRRVLIGWEVNGAVCSAAGDATRCVVEALHERTPSVANDYERTMNASRMASAKSGIGSCILA